MFFFLSLSLSLFPLFSPNIKTPTASPFASLLSSLYRTPHPLRSPAQPHLPPVVVHLSSRCDSLGFSGILWDSLRFWLGFFWDALGFSETEAPIFEFLESESGKFALDDGVPSEIPRPRPWKLLAMNAAKVDCCKSIVSARERERERKREREDERKKVEERKKEKEWERERERERKRERRDYKEERGRIARGEAKIRIEREPAVVCTTTLCIER